MCWTKLYESKQKSHGTQNIATYNRTTQKTTKMINTDPTKKHGLNGAHKG
jgi:hypothetical protein